MIATTLNLNADLFAPMEKVVDVHHLQMKDFAAWLRKQARLFGRKAEIANNRTNAVEAWLQSLGFGFVSFQSGGEIEIESSQYYTGWISFIHFMTDEDGYHIRSVSEWLRACENENPEAYLIEIGIEK